MRAGKPQGDGESVRPQTILSFTQGGASASGAPREVADGRAEGRRDEDHADFEEESEEGIKSKCIPCGTKPSEQEVEEHERTHMPFRNWCQHCVFGKAVNNPHKSQDHEGQGLPHVVLDYMYLNEKYEKGKRKATIEGEGLPIVVIYDSRNSKGAYAFAVPTKGECEYAIRKTSQVIGKNLGYHKFIYKGDQEPA